MQVEVLEKVHPTVGILVRSNGEVLVPASGHNKAHWAFGCRHSTGYRMVYVCGHRYFVHRLVAETFLGEIPSGYEVDHIDRDRSNNAVSNLRIVTRSENLRNRADHDRVEARGGAHSYEDKKQFEREKAARYYQRKHKTHRRVCFADGKSRWIPREEAILLLVVPLTERVF